MYKRLIKILIFVLLQPILTYSQYIQVRLFNGYNINNLKLNVFEGKYQIFTNVDRTYKIKLTQIVDIKADGDKVSLYNNKKKIGSYDTLHIMGMSINNKIGIENKQLKIVGRKYCGDFKITASNNNILADNIVHIDDYLSGVVEAEAGYNAPLEYYKVQAIISRTYLYKTIYKERQINQAQGYFIGDDVTFQVYKGVTNKNLDIKKAVIHTRGLVIIDSTLSLITAVFHSNSGGKTANSEDVWLSSRPYLKKTFDPFSLEQKNSEWTTSIPLNKWLSYFKSKGININDKYNRSKIINITQNDRIKHLVVNGNTLLFTDIRYFFKLKSAWFSVKQQQNNVILTGKGYGHGVGLSQQGAIQMAKEKHSFLDIIYFYYTNVKVVHFSTIFLTINPF